MHTQLFLAFSLYISILFCIAISFHKKGASSDEMLLGSRSMNFWVTALSAHASDMSSWIFMAFPMSIFIGGIPNMWIAISLLFGMFCSWQFIAPKLRSMTEYYNCYTLPSFFAKRFKNSNSVRLIATLVILIFMTYYLAGGLISIGFLFESIFEIKYTVGISIAAFVVMAYVLIGGFVSVAWADLFQAIFLLVALAIVPIVALTTFENGFTTVVDAAAKAHIPLGLFGEDKTTSLFHAVTTFLGWGLGYLGMPHIIVKFMGIKNVKDMRKSQIVGISWQIIALVFSALIGLVAIAFFKSDVQNPELIFIEMVKELMPPFGCGLILCGVIAATISTMDSQILTAASTICEDLYKLFSSKELGSKEKVRIFRISVFLISVAAFCIALGKSATIMDTIYFAWSGLGSSFAPLLILSLYSKIENPKAATLGIAAGSLLAFTWPWINQWLSTSFDFQATIPSMIPAFSCSFFLILLFGYNKKRNRSFLPEE